MSPVAALAAVLLGLLFTPAAYAADPPRPPVVEVDGAHLVDGSGRALQLRGVNRSGAEYSCVQGHGIFDGPVDDRSIAAMARWKINAVRIPLNEDCWLGSPGIESSLSGSAYRAAISEYVERLAEAGMVVILDLHWAGTPGELALGQAPMARAERSEEFWRSVGSTFGERDGIMFDAYNEPQEISWECWRDGCGHYAGMQDLVDAIRSTGTDQPIILSGIDWGGDLRRWRESRPDDPLDSLVAGAHLYDFKRCADSECWDAEIEPVTAHTPVVFTEFGDTDCDGDFSQKVMSWADSNQVSYIAWTWNPWDCAGGPAVIGSFDGSPTGFGRLIKDRFAARMAPPDTPVRIPVGVTPF